MPFYDIFKIFYMSDYVTWKGIILVLFFTTYMPFIISCPTAVDRTSNYMLNTSGKSWHICLVPNLKWKFFSVSPLSIMLAIIFCFIYNLYHTYEVFSSIACLSDFSFLIMKWCWITSSVFFFFSTYWDYHVIFFLTCITLIEFCMVSHPCILRTNTNCSCL